MAVLLAVLSAVVLGSADFVGGLATRRVRAVLVVTWSNVAGLLTAATAALVLLPGRVTLPDAGWGVLAGLCGSTGAVLLYYALANGAMSVVAPTTAATAAALPPVVGYLLGEPFSVRSLVGISCAVVSIVLVSLSSPGERGSRRADLPVVAASLGAGVGFGGLFVLLAQTSTGSALWPLVWARCATVPLLLAVVALRRLSLRLDRVSWGLALLSGVLDMTSTIVYLLAVRQGALSVVGVLASLYPVSTVLLARLVLNERIRPVQLAGIALALGGISLLALT